MRVIDNIPHPTMTISIFQMNEKYMVKFEAGPMEQTFKYIIQEVKGVENLKTLIDAVFIETCRLRFNEMYLQLQSTLKI